MFPMALLLFISLPFAYAIHPYSSPEPPTPLGSRDLTTPGYRGTKECFLSRFSPSTKKEVITHNPDNEPEFLGSMDNITVPSGRTVKLSCSVKNLGSYKVAWMHFEQSAILAVHSHVITRNPRISVSHENHRTWNLHITDVRQEDGGRYMCQINTATAKTQFGYLNVVDLPATTESAECLAETRDTPVVKRSTGENIRGVRGVPPDIDDSLSSSDVIIREGSNVSLSCIANGSPTPHIKWRRDDGLLININKTYTVSEFEGVVLEMTKISRLDMGSYLCIATNGVPPSVSKRIRVSVDFPPMLWIPHQLVGAPVGFNVTLECFTEAHPNSLNYWTREDGQMIHDTRKYMIQSEPLELPYKTQMMLTITKLRRQDFGTYKCVAKNPRGETDGTIRLYASALMTSTTQTTLEDGVHKDTQIDLTATELNKTSEAPKTKPEKGTKQTTTLNNLEKLMNKEKDESEQNMVQYNGGGSYQKKGSALYIIFLTPLLLQTLQFITDGRFKAPGNIE